MSSTHKMLLITTGGTIAGQVAANLNEKENIKTSTDLVEILSTTVNQLQKKYNITIEIDPEELCNIDSSDINHKHWSDLTKLIKTKYDEYDSFVITHGTNTLGYTCAALSFAIANPSKPIVLTGSQVSAGLPGSDAVTNLENAIRVALWRSEDRRIKGVVAVFGSHIITGTRVKKDTEFDYDAFKSFNTGSIGRIGRIINIFETNLKKHVSYLSTGQYPEARNSKNLLCNSDFEMKIASITEFPGMSPDIFQNLIDNNDIKAFILRAFGAGDPSTELIKAFQFLKRKNIPIVVTTQAPNGNSNFQVNEPGRILHEENLAIPAYDMSIESQTTKLAWLLAKLENNEMTYEQLCSEMVHDLRGEIDVMWEIG